MTLDAAESRAERAARDVSVGTLTWAATATIFILLRLAFAWNAPVGGFELAGLSGSWQAHIGASDTRFVPTLFQAFSAALFQLGGLAVRRSRAV